MEDDIVELQVSGQLFKTYRKTLTSIPNSLLGTYFTKLENKSIFLDRNPKLFTLILEYYRTQYLTISNQTSWNSIWIEINYFKLHDVIQQQQIEFIPGMIGNEFDTASLFKDSINCMMACRFNDMIQLIIYNQIHDFKFQIDLKGNVIGIPEALNSIQSSKSFWKDFGKYFVGKMVID
ncbi:BTB/POZ protein [Globomyces pollinis-pini]|nr:BTB/POZ protein [Globomyces pollinis-pini]